MSIRKKTWLIFCGILILVGLAGFVVWPNGPDIKIGNYFKELKYHLGLDLQGGAHLVYETDVSKIRLKEQGAAILAVRDVIEKRISRLEKMQKNNNKFDKQTTRNFQVMHKSLVVLRLQMFYLADRTDVLSTALERVGQHKRILKKLNR